MYISLYSGTPPSIIENTWPAKDIDMMLDAYVQNEFDFDGWQKAGASIAWGVNAHIGQGQDRYSSGDWAAFTPPPPKKPKTELSREDQDRLRLLASRRYGS